MRKYQLSFLLLIFISHILMAQNNQDAYGYTFTEDSTNCNWIDITQKGQKIEV